MNTNINDKLAAAGVEVRLKKDSRVMRFLGWLFGLFGYAFMERAWTTISGRRIYAPNHVDLTKLDDHRMVIEHELVHVAQARWWRVPGLWQFLYLMFPVPVFLAYGRWRSEREGYMVNIAWAVRYSDAERTDLRSFVVDYVNHIVHTLWKVYLMPWPKAWMRSWFMRRADAMIVNELSLMQPDDLRREVIRELRGAKLEVDDRSQRIDSWIVAGRRDHIALCVMIGHPLEVFGGIRRPHVYAPYCVDVTKTALVRHKDDEIVEPPPDLVAVIGRLNAVISRYNEGVDSGEAASLQES